MVESPAPEIIQSVWGVPVCVFSQATALTTGAAQGLVAACAGGAAV
jgi:hypothetical protein